jgi:CDP-diacylglycerol--serine O-phosphatidyltransferase
MIRVKDNIPNSVTCLNLFFGCLAAVMAFESRYELALLCIVLSAVADFFDGMLARLLGAHSIIGKDLDSLADDVSFGFAPSVIVFSLFKEMDYPGSMANVEAWLPYAAFLISIFSALRLAKFNNDSRQTSSFVGLPVPANALFWASLVAGSHGFLTSPAFHPLYLLALVCLSAWLLVSEIPMFSLKFKNLSWRNNKVSFLFLLVCVPLLFVLGISAFAAIIGWYILLSALTARRKVEERG